MQLKDAWYTDFGVKQERKKFFIVYQYTNLGPRKEGFGWSASGTCVRLRRIRTISTAVMNWSARTVVGLAGAPIVRLVAEGNGGDESNE